MDRFGPVLIKSQTKPVFPVSTYLKPNQTKYVVWPDQTKPCNPVRFGRFHGFVFFIFFLLFPYNFVYVGWNLCQEKL